MSKNQVLYTEKQDRWDMDCLEDWNGEGSLEAYLLKWFNPNGPVDEYGQENIDKWLDSEDCPMKQHLFTSEGLLRIGGGLRDYKTKTHHVKRVSYKKDGVVVKPGNAGRGYFEMTPL